MIGYLDCSTGVSGDKFLGAVLDVGETSGDFTAEHLRAIVASLAPEARVAVERVVSRGVTAVGVRVTAAHEPHSRTWADIERLIHAADLPEPVRDAALRTFEALAEAEAAAHGVDPADVHFHEVGAIDSIVDIVGVCAGLHALGVTELAVSRIAVGSGTVETSHGVLPVPAPATAALLVDVPVVAGPAEGELTTPTGAALVTTLASGYRIIPPMTPLGIGYGAGTRDIGCPNVCRIILGDPAPPDPALTAETVTLLESNVDHLSPEAVAFAAEQLLSAGALDVWQTPIVMKKGRLAVTLSVLCAAEAAEALASRLVALTGTLGVRRTELPRLVAEREVVEVETEWGPARVKLGAGRARPEHDDVAAIALRTGLSYAHVADAIRAAAERSARDPQ